MAKMLNLTLKNDESRGVSKGACVQNFAQPVAGLGQIALALLVVLIASAFPQKAVATTKEKANELAFSEDHYLAWSGRRNLDLLGRTISLLCGQAINPVPHQQVACQWPTLMKDILEALDDLSQKASRGDFRRSALYEPKSALLEDVIKAGAAAESADLFKTVRFIQLVHELSGVTDALRQALHSDSWMITRALNPNLSELTEVEDEAILFEAWIQSEDPMGFFERLARLDSRFSSQSRILASCLMGKGDSRLASARLEGAIAANRSIFKEISIVRAARGLNVPGLLDLEASHDELQMSELNRQLENLSDVNLSEVGNELDACRSLAWALHAMGMSAEEINRGRVACVKAQREARPFRYPFPAGTALLQRALLIREVRRESGQAPDSARRMAASLVQSLRDVTPAAFGNCPKELAIIAQPLAERAQSLLKGASVKEEHQ